MKRAPFSAALILTALSILCWLFPNILPVLSVIASGALFLFLLFYVFLPNRAVRDLLYYAVCILICTLFLWQPIHSYYETQTQYDGQTARVTAELCKEPTLTASGTYRCIASSEEIPQWFEFYSTAYPGEVGDEFTADFKFRKPKTDRELTYLSQGIVLRAEVVSKVDNIEFRKGEPSFRTLSASLRKYVSATLRRAIGSEQGGFMTSVLTGDRSNLSEETEQALSDTGMLHIVAVSGLHVSVFLSFGLFFLQKIRSEKLQYLITILLLFPILLFSGFTPSVVRAVIMTGVLYLGNSFGIKTDPLNRFGYAALIILLAAPYAALSVSFELSFAAAFGILCFAKPLNIALIHWLFRYGSLRSRTLLNELISLTAVSISAFLFTLPLLWFRFGSFTVWSMLLSPLVLPVLQYCFYGSLILLLFWPLAQIVTVLLPFARMLALLIRYGVDFMVYLTKFASELITPAEGISPVLIWILGGAIAVIGLILFFRPAAKAKAGSRKRTRILLQKIASLILVAISLLAAYQVSDSITTGVLSGSVTPGQEILQTAYLDVGQGNCFVCVLDGEACVIDCGGTKKAGNIAADYLTSVDVESVKFVLISHLHSDHANGLKDLCEQKKVEEIIIPYTEGDAALYASITMFAAEKNIPVTVLEADGNRTLKAANFHLLTKHLDPQSNDQNENSIVAYAEYENYRALFTGDITSKAEKRFVTAYGDSIICDVLSVPHHGSKSSSSKQFLETVKPTYAIISVGEGNSYGHPTEEALSRLRAVGAKILRTDELSTIIIRSDGKVMEVIESDGN